MRITILISLVLSLTACAYTTSKPIKYERDMKSSGFVYYDPKPILLINDNVAEIKFVPNFERAYAVRFNAFLAKNNVTLDISNGLLSKVNSALDSTGFLTLVQGATTEALKAGKQISEAFGETAEGEKTEIYEFEFSEEGKLVGLKPIKILEDSIQE